MILIFLSFTNFCSCYYFFMSLAQITILRISVINTTKRKKRVEKERKKSIAINIFTWGWQRFRWNFTIGKVSCEKLQYTGIAFKAKNIIITFGCAFICTGKVYLITEFMHMSSFATKYYRGSWFWYFVNVFGCFFFSFFKLWENMLVFNNLAKYIHILSWVRLHFSMSQYLQQQQKVIKRISISRLFTTLFPLYHYCTMHIFFPHLLFYVNSVFLTFFLQCHRNCCCKFNKDENNCKIKC